MPARRVPCCSPRCCCLCCTAARPATTRRRRGAAYRSAQWEGGKGAVIETLRRQGYLRAKVADSEARIDVPRASAALSATFDTGPRLAFGELTIEGLKRYEASIVENLRPFRA